MISEGERRPPSGMWRRLTIGAMVTSVVALGAAAPARAAAPDTTLGVILTRMISETSQHAGHADIVRELIDGRTSPGNAEVGDVAWWRDWHDKIQSAADRPGSPGRPDPRPAGSPDRRRPPPRRWSRTGPAVRRGSRGRAEAAPAAGAR